MRWLSVVSLFALHTEAAASSCYLGPYVPVNPQLGCEITVYQHATSSLGAPKLEVRRDNVALDVTGETREEQRYLVVEYPQYDCDGSLRDGTNHAEVYNVFHVKIDGAYVGEELFVDGMNAGRIQETTTACIEAPPPSPSCASGPVGCDYVEEEPTDDGGCNTSGSSSGAAMLALLALLRRRKR